MNPSTLVSIIIEIFYLIEQTNQSNCGHLMTDFSQQTCIDKAEGNTTYFYWKTECIPFCREFEKEGHEGDSCPCPPGYKCQKMCSNSKRLCTTDDDCESRRDRCKDACGKITGNTPLCMAYHAKTFEYEKTFYSALKFKPKCTNSGEWQAKQCKGGVGGRCFCYDAVGERIFGQARFGQSQNMTCSCSRRRADILATGRNYVSLHCDEQGNFEALQCDSGLCWCAESKTGHLVSPVVPQTAMTKLPCYKTVETGGQYLRKCESITYAHAYIEKILRNHGMIFVNMGNVQCDGDGAYGRYNLTGSIARCTWRDGSQIGSWQSDATTDISKLNCNCARDYKMYGHQLTCDGSGNYVPVQSVINKGISSFFCVDSDGYPKTNFFSSTIANCTLYY